MSDDLSRPWVAARGLGGSLLVSHDCDSDLTGERLWRVELSGDADAAIDLTDAEVARLADALADLVR
ncbi:hypothetical protein [Gordonia alkanivorans]|uniref:hypothetical protein n=1 Tax=Gordonia alkanivorans TaxID=84096 RepID=UPI00244C0E83|nr:hypothetical protein [Gordonia alkanivorans]MDH3006253.1 hypothetical protein [Gordonia alkanivorans]MDH3014010.1 hypothetical protein [Gordonia alkanivorans]MDH3042683.1 hypothetical protein [Gordonia alkanivorans]